MTSERKGAKFVLYPGHAGITKRNCIGLASAKKPLKRTSSVMSDIKIAQSDSKLHKSTMTLIRSRTV